MMSFIYGMGYVLGFFVGIPVLFGIGVWLMKAGLINRIPKWLMGVGVIIVVGFLTYPAWWVWSWPWEAEPRFDTQTGEAQVVREPVTGAEYPLDTKFDPQTGRPLQPVSPNPMPTPEREPKVNYDILGRLGQETSVYRLLKGDVLSLKLMVSGKSTPYIRLHDGGARENITLALVGKAGRQFVQFTMSGPEWKDREVDCFGWVALGSFDPKAHYNEIELRLTSERPINISVIALAQDSRCPV